MTVIERFGDRLLTAHSGALCRANGTEIRMFRATGHPVAVEVRRQAVLSYVTVGCQFEGHRCYDDRIAVE
jgi:hypothetical protein